MKRTTVAVVGAFLFAPGLARSQASFEIELQPSIESFTEADASGEVRGAVSGDATAEYEYAGRRGRVYYTLDAGSFAIEGDWRYFQHDAGIVHRLGGEKRRVYLGVSGRLRRNGEAWSAADYQGFSAMANVEWVIAPTVNLRVGTRLDARRFADLPELDQLQPDGFVSLLVNLPSRTTLLGEVHLGGKWYEGAALSASSASAHAPARWETSGRGRGMGPQVRPGAISSPWLEGTVTRAGQVSWMARVAQSLTDRTGLSLQVSGRSAFGSVPPVLVTTPPAFLDDGVYDDPFASDALAVGASLKHARPGGAVLQASASWQRKDYVAAPALDASGFALPGAELRSDEVWRAQAGASFPLWPARTGRWSVALDVTGFLVHRRSNDAFYDYASRGFLMGLALAY
ncbi:MAG TPA: hypothetical protein VLL75_18390 [Vicinamibacteria bacterium]|nr:hypothetical protein [Vicinamibacteria bacterium]